MSRTERLRMPSEAPRLRARALPAAILSVWRFWPRSNEGRVSVDRRKKGRDMGDLWVQEPWLLRSQNSVAACWNKSVDP